MQDVEPEPFIDQFWKLGFAEQSVFGESFSPYDFIPLNSTFFHYTGSTTTPPCRSDVKWFLRTSPVIISQEQLDKFREGLKEMPQTREAVHNNIPYNNRPIQSLGSRTVKRVHLSSSSSTVSFVLSLSLAIIAAILI
eukprot:c12430_g1_i2.p2 GENE.c12430_g1_i2~~c12430_g1_i2.p2  ORF type:complete len:137 (+),score=18.87 c12430_g1_i2:552-962(+)